MGSFFRRAGSESAPGSTTSFVLFGLLAIIAGPAWGAEGRIPISGPTTITQEGSYIVTQNIVADGSVLGGSIIVINASHVTVDLDGHTLSSALTTADVITNGSSGTFRDIAVRNGKISGGQLQVQLYAISGEISVVDVSCVPGPGGSLAYGISLSGSTGSGNAARALVKNCTVVSSAFYGIVLNNIDSGRVEGNDVRLCAQEGIRLVSVNNTLVSENSVASNSFGIITLNSYNNIIRDNTLSDNTNSGINLTTSTNTLITGNTVSLNYEGIALNALSNGNTIAYNNTSQNTLGTGNQGNGIRLSRSANNYVVHNTVTRNDGHGIYLYGTAPGSDFNWIGWNMLEANGQGLVAGQQCGLNIATGSEDNNYSFNRSGGLGAGGNPGGAYCIVGVRNNATVPDAHGNVTQ